jgi:hypothetical protein
MSDLQLLTGLAIIISGFAQLRCGLTRYHWQKIVDTAWFACVTHLCCLTFLRDHLLKNRIAQLWRVPGMMVLTTMIMYALTTTSQYEWMSETGWDYVTNSDQAICFLAPSFDMEFSGFDSDRKLRIILSILFLGFGLINRLRRLYHAPNLVVTTVRHWVSHKARHFLEYFYGRGSADSLVSCIAAVLVYRPLLAIFLAVRLLIDGLTSMAFEVNNNALDKEPTAC